MKRQKAKGNYKILLYPVILSKEFVNFLVAGGACADIIVLMSMNSIIMSPAIFLIWLVLKVAGSVSGLLLRRLAR